MKTGGRATYPPTPAPSTGRNAVTAYSVLTPIRSPEGWGRFAVRFAFSPRACVRGVYFLGVYFRVFSCHFREIFALDGDFLDSLSRVRVCAALFQHLVDDGDVGKLVGAD